VQVCLTLLRQTSTTTDAQHKFKVLKSLEVIAQENAKKLPSTMGI
jgi:hypothetical protein